MLRFIIQKILNKKWLISCMLIGTVLLIAITCCNPMYREAALQKMLTDEMEEYLEVNNRYPAVAKVSGTLSGSRLSMYSSELFPDYKTNADTLASMYKHPAVQKLTYLNTHGISMTLEEKRDNMGSMDLAVSQLSDLDDHVEIIYGEKYDNAEGRSEEYLDCIINEAMMISRGLIIGDTLVSSLYLDKERQLKLRIVGVFQAKDPTEPYWVNDPLSYESGLFVSSDDFERIFMADMPVMITSVIAEYYTVFDYTGIKKDEINDFIITDNEIRNDCGGGLYTCDFNYEQSFATYRTGSNRVNITMWIFQIPVMILLAVFIFMVSNQIISIEQGEIAMLKSRGVSKGQLIAAYLIQGMIISVIAFAIGLPLGYYFCNLFGSTKSFMEFSVKTSIDAQFTLDAVIYALIAAFAAVLIMTIPVFKYANFSIVEQKVNKKKKTKPLWQKIFLDFILIAVSVYGLYSFNKQKDTIISDVSGNSAIDPLLYFSSTLFILGLALLLLRIIPLLSRFIFFVRKRKWKPAGYASFLQINKSIRQQSFIIVFLVLTLALGIFNAVTARTITDNEETRITYDNGAILNLEESWRSNLAGVTMGYEDKLEYYEPDFDKYAELRPHINGMAKVVKDEKAMVYAYGKSTDHTVLYMSVNTKDFGNSAFMPRYATKFHWYNYLNALAANPDGVIISRNLAENMGLSLNDELVVFRTDEARENHQISFTVSAIVDAWPGYESKVLKKQKDGSEVYVDRYLVVSNYFKNSKILGLEPYEIWISAKDTGFIYDFAKEHELGFKEFHDSTVDADEIKEEPFYQITSGMLTLTFIVVLVLSMIGFLIYWITSIRSRELMFGIYRAMGISMREIITMLVNEHIFGSLIPIIFGVAVGIASAIFFVPLIELTYLSTYTTVPTKIIVDRVDMIRLGACVIIMLLACFLVIGRILKNMKVTQALKLGED